MSRRISESEFKSRVNSMIERSHDFEAELAPVINWVLIRTIQEFVKDEVFEFDDDEYYYVGFDFEFDVDKFIIIFECESENPELESKKYFEFNFNNGH